MPYSTDIKDYYRRAWGLEDRPKFKYGGSWADWMTNFSDQMTFEEYLQMDIKTKKPHALDEKADGGRIRKKFNSGGMEIQTLNPLFPTKDPTSDDFKPLDVPGAIIPPLAIGAGAKRLKDIFFSKNKDESKEEIVERIETIKKQPDQEPPEDPWDPNKLLEVLESTTYNIAETRLKNKAMNYLDKKINERALELGPKIKDYAKRKNILSKEFDKLLGDNVRIARVTKDGQVTYVRSQGKRGEQTYSKNLIETLNKRDDVTFKREQPFRSKGFVKTNEFKKILMDKGANLTEDWSIRQFAGTNNIKFLDAGTNLGGSWVKLPSEEKLNQLAKQYISVDAKVEKAKELIEEFDLKSWTEITKALNQQGYTRLDNDVLKKYFPELRGQKHTDIDFVPSKTPTAVIHNIRKGKIKTYGNTKLEHLLTTLKNKQGFGEEVHLMHPQQKEKPSKKLYDFSDLMYGSAKENSEYSHGLEAIRNSITNALRTIKFDHEGKDLNKEINIPFSLVNKFGLPKKMTVEKYIDRLNYMLTDLAWLTEGKVRGELLDVWGKKMNFVDNKHGIDWSLVPGKGLLEGQMKKYKGLFEKFKTTSGNTIKLDANGAPILKKGKKLTQNQKEILWTIMEGLTEQLVSAKESEPVSLETVKEVFKQIPKAKGGLALSGVDQYILNRYK